MIAVATLIDWLEQAKPCRVCKHESPHRFLMGTARQKRCWNPPPRQESCCIYYDAWLVVREGLEKERLEQEAK